MIDRHPILSLRTPARGVKVEEMSPVLPLVHDVSLCQNEHFHFTCLSAVKHCRRNRWKSMHGRPQSMFPTIGRQLAVH